jgi:hypothetical protein
MMNKNIKKNYNRKFSRRNKEGDNEWVLELKEKKYK